MVSLDFSQIPGSSPIFLDFINARNSFFDSRFPLGSKLFSSPELLAEHARTFQGREAIAEIFRETLEPVGISPAQQQNLDRFSKPNSLVTVAGQQVGFLGGPLYTVLKASSALALAEKLSASYAELDFVPVFWLEDNDHDAEEAALVEVLTQDYSVVRLHAPGRSVDPRLSVSELSFGNEIQDIIASLENILPATPFKQELLAELAEIYVPGRSWAEAFLRLLNGFFAEKGLLFFQASLARKKGLFAPLIREEIINPGRTKAAVETGIEALRSHNYHIQAEPSDLNVFYHHDGARIKLAYDESSHSFIAGEMKFTQDELVELVHSRPGDFSPNVILRPIIQDSILPNVAYIGGPGEFAYWTELHEAYGSFGVFQSAFVMRHSAGFLDRRVERFLEKHDLPPNFFFRSWPEIEKELTRNILDRDMEALLENAGQEIAQLYRKIHSAAVAIDTNMDGAVNAAAHRTDKLFERMSKKITAAQKKKSAEYFRKYSEAWSLLFPEGKLQERALSPIVFVNSYGKGNFLRLLAELTSYNPDSHFIVGTGLQEPSEKNSDSIVFS